MKHIWKAFIVVSLAMLLSSCTIQTVQQYESMRDEERSVQMLETAAPDITEQEEGDGILGETPSGKEWAEQDGPASSIMEKDFLAKPTPEPKEGDNTAEDPTKVQQSAVTDQGGQIERPQVTSTVGAASTDNVHAQPSPKPALQSTPQEQESSQLKKRYVTIAIHAQTLLDHWDLLEPALQDEKYVPKDGIILPAVKYELLSEKDTVWDILLRATKEYKIQLEYQGTSSNIYNSVYVEGINHLYEFSAGSLSGWMYQVNGTFPSYGCDQYVLEDGDVIEWHYTVDLGRDLGTGD